MRALLIDSPGRLILREVPLPVVGPGDCLIRVVRAGICGTDLQMLDGYADFRGIPGHEFAGIVEAVGPDVDAHWTARRVVGEINIGCRRCSWCHAGVKEHCDARSVVGIRGHDGAFAEYLSLPVENLHELPDSVDDAAGVFVEPLAAACRILEQLAIGPQSDVAVLGDGRMGLLVAQVLRTATPHVTMFGRHEEKLEIARRLGIDARRGDEAASAGRFGIVIEVTGRPDGLTRALEFVRPRGSVVLKSTFHGVASLPTWPIVVDEVTIVGSRCGPFEQALKLLARRAVNVGSLISRTATLDEFESAVLDARRSLKVVFSM